MLQSAMNDNTLLTDAPIVLRGILASAHAPFTIVAICALSGIYEAISKEKIQLEMMLSTIDANTGAVKVTDSTNMCDKIKIMDFLCSSWGDQMHMPLRTISSWKHMILSS